MDCLTFFFYYFSSSLFIIKFCFSFYFLIESNLLFVLGFTLPHHERGTIDKKIGSLSLSIYWYSVYCMENELNGKDQILC